MTIKQRNTIRLGKGKPAIRIKNIQRILMKDEPKGDKSKVIKVLAERIK